MEINLVTGGAGFVGSHLVRALLGKDLPVRILDNFSTGKRENLASMQNVEIVEGDLRDPLVLKACLKDVEVIYHLAAFVSVPKSMLDPVECFSINVAGTAGLLEAARLAGVHKVVLASSTAVYGDTKTFPIGEELALHPLSPYAVSKQVTEIYARLYTQVLGLPVLPLRFFNIYGPRQRPDSDYAAAIPLFLDRLLKKQPFIIFGDGKQTRDFIYVGDVVDACILAAEGTAAGEPVNICTGREVTVQDLVKKIAKLSTRPPKVEYQDARRGDIYRSVGDPEKAIRELGFQAHTSLVDGLSETFEWMRTARSGKNA